MSEHSISTHRSESTATQRTSSESCNSETTTETLSFDHDLYVLRFGKYRHFLEASPDTIKQALYRELGAAEYVDWYSFDGLHPLAYLYNKRRESASSTESEEVPEPLSPSASLCPATRLAWQTRTITYDSISSDGCVIQRGFVPGKMPPVPGSPSTEISPSPAETKPSPFRLAKAQSRDERKPSCVTDEDLSETKCKAPGIVSYQQPGGIGAQRRRAMVARENRYANARYHNKGRSVSPPKPKNELAKDRPPPRLVEASAAENAIESDEEDD